MDLKNKTVLVTGGSRGIGRAIAQKFAAYGCNVAIVYAGNADAADQTVQTLTEKGVQAKAYQCDVADFSQTQTLVETIIADFGGVDVLINNAGIVRDGLLLSMKEEDFDSVLSINLKGAFNMTKHLFSHFMRKRSGRIINITSIIGLTGNAGQANYAAAKAGLIGLTKSTAKELASRGVTCNAVAPGFIQSEMTDSLPEKTIKAYQDMIPAKSLGNPDDVAELVAFLASDAARYITGDVIRVDGGLAM